MRRSIWWTRCCARTAAELVDRVVPLTALWGTRGAELAHELGTVQADPPAMALRLHNALAGRLDGDISPHRELLDHAHHALAETGRQAGEHSGAFAEPGHQ